jgi:hypothetical protein
MRSVIPLGLALVTLGIALPSSVAEAEKPRTFAGRYDDTMLTGFAGVGAMTDRCRAVFGNKTRVCTSAEILASRTTGGPAAWVLPVIVGGATSGFAADVSGVSAAGPSNLSCDGWATTDPTNDTGLLLNSSGGFELSACNTARAIACCK